MELTHENFEYTPSKKNSILILSITVPFFFFTFVLTILAIISLYQQKRYKTAYTLYVLLVTPTYIGQFICFIYSILYLWKSTARNELKFGRIPSWLWTTSIILYGFFSYVMISVLVYFFADLTIFDMTHENFFIEPFCSIEQLQNSKILPKHQEQLQYFKNLSKKGYENAKKKKVVFSFLVRNSSYHVNKMRVKIETLGKHFKDYHVLLFENDSSDGSRELLKSWASQNKHVTVMDCCEFGNCDCKLQWKKATHDGVHSQSRIERMRVMRQYMLNHVKTHFRNWDYSIVMDFDLEGSIFKDGFFTSFAFENNFDVMFASGLTSFPCLLNHHMLYDAWAFLAEKDNLKDINKENIIKDFLYQTDVLMKYPIDFELQKAKSGFNGLAIYKIDSIMDAAYVNTISRSNCEHIDLHLHMIDNGFSNIYFNPSMILFAGQQGEKRITYLKNIFKKK